ncbi:TetR/AcrR family transcriptional regulator [Microbacterium invictum]|uniref:AcrR family transcriptional regulator n=1 Tax=Microbacterium invictum TaxID=515415 RepID=A0AA40SMU0_9MICO|nr:TetR/AcrR family transcriptional regulator [Microbacterium invictum]MBB4139138.1 AcrR family transcriptional regulator [Microbacterium invictum]
MFSSEAADAGTKSDRTRARLRAIALRSFRERGYDATTVRQIAAEAGVSVGVTNYHFASKNRLVQELYVDVQERHRAAAVPALDGVDDLIDRLTVIYRTGLDELTPYHPHAGEFVAAAMSPKSDVNPLSAESAPARDITEALFARAVSGAKHSLPADIADRLPAVLFLGHLLLALYWAYDRSPGQERTSRLLERGLGLLRLALPLVRLPLVRRPLREMLDLIGEVRS